MIEEALRNHLIEQPELDKILTSFAEQPAVFSNEAPADNKKGWAAGSHYPRIVFYEDIQGDPERTAGGILMVVILCKKDEQDKQYPEDIAPIVRDLIHGYFFSNGTFTVAAQFKNASIFNEPTDEVTGCEIAFDLLGFPVLTTSHVDVISRFNEWTSKIDGLYVINHGELPSPAWKPGKGETAVYWRRLNEGPSGRIRSRYSMIGRLARIKGHIFAEDIATASAVADDLIIRLYADKRLLKDGETPIMVNSNNTQDYGADPLMTGQLTVEAEYAVIVRRANDQVIQHIKYD